MKRSLKVKLATYLLVASSFNKPNNSFAVVRNIQSNYQNKQVDMSQMVKTGAVAGVVAGLLSLVIVIPLIVINSKADEKEVGKKILQENKDKLQNLFNGQQKKCKIKNIQKYWNALNKIAQEDFDDIWKGIYNYHTIGKRKSKFSNARVISNNYVTFAVLSSKGGKRNIETIEDCKKHLSFESFKNIFNGEYQVKNLEIISDDSRITFKFLTAANIMINVSFESEDYGLSGKSPYKNDHCIESDWTFLRITSGTCSCDFRFTDVKRDFGLEF